MLQNCAPSRKRPLPTSQSASVPERQGNLSVRMRSAYLGTRKAPLQSNENFNVSSTIDMYVNNVRFRISWRHVIVFEYRIAANKMGVLRMLMTAEAVPHLLKEFKPTVPQMGLAKDYDYDRTLTVLFNSSIKGKSANVLLMELEAALKLIQLNDHCSGTCFKKVSKEDEADMDAHVARLERLCVGYQSSESAEEPVPSTSAVAPSIHTAAAATDSHKRPKNSVPVCATQAPLMPQSVAAIYKPPPQWAHGSSKSPAAMALDELQPNKKRVTTNKRVNGVVSANGAALLPRPAGRPVPPVTPGLLPHPHSPALLPNPYAPALNPVLVPGQLSYPVHVHVQQMAGASGTHHILRMASHTNNKYTTQTQPSHSQQSIAPASVTAINGIAHQVQAHHSQLQRLTEMSNKRVTRPRKKDKEPISEVVLDEDDAVKTPVASDNQTQQSGSHSETSYVQMVSVGGDSKCSQPVSLRAADEVTRFEGVTITGGDLACLQHEEFLNDTIMDFYLQYIVKRLVPEDRRQSIHVFSQFFWQQLNKSLNLTPQQIMQNNLTEEQVEALKHCLFWEGNPHESLRRHVVANPRSKPKMAAPVRGWPEGVRKTFPPRVAQYDQVKKWHKKIDIFSKDFLVVPVNIEQHWHLIIICYPRLLLTATTPSQPPTDKAEPHCYIVVFDSMFGEPKEHYESVNVVRDFLVCEWMFRKGTQPKPSFPIDGQTFKGVYPVPPQQDNYSDCGLFVLEYAEQFLLNPPAVGSKIDVSMFSADWVCKQAINQKRARIETLLLDMAAAAGKNILKPQSLNVNVPGASAVDCSSAGDGQIVNEPSIADVIGAVSTCAPKPHTSTTQSIAPDAVNTGLVPSTAPAPSSSATPTIPQTTTTPVPVSVCDNPPTTAPVSSYPHNQTSPTKQDQPDPDNCSSPCKLTKPVSDTTPKRNESSTVDVVNGTRNALASLATLYADSNSDDE